MLEKVVINNFQSHVNSEIALSPITIINGTSNGGKSAIFRSLYWALQNGIQGDDFVNYNSKGDCSVSVTLDSGETIKRYRTKSKNGYVMDDASFEAVGRSVPKEIQDVLKIGEINFQSQFDSYFLINRTAGAKGDFLNELSGLGILDDTVSSLNNKVRESATVLKAIDASMFGQRAELESLSKYNLAEAERLMLDCRDVVAQQNEVILESNKLKMLCIEYMEIIDKLSALEKMDFNQCTLFFAQINAELNAVQEIQSQILSLQKSIDVLTINQLAINASWNGDIDFTQITKDVSTHITDVRAFDVLSLDCFTWNNLITQIASVDVTVDFSAVIEDVALYQDTTSLIGIITDSYNRYASICQQVSSVDGEMLVLHKQLLEIKAMGLACPTCGQNITEDCSLWAGNI